MSEKISFKRAEIPLNKFNDVAIPHHLDLLQKHKHNIKMYQLQHEWDRVRIEQNNASRLVKQLKQLLYEMEMLRSQVQESDLEKFDQHTQKSRQTVQNVITEYLVLIKKTPTVQPRIITFDDESGEEQTVTEQPLDRLVISDIEYEKDLIKEKEACLISAQELQRDLQDLRSIFVQLQSMVQDQAEPVEQIETMVENATMNVQEGALQLAKAASYKRAMYPITGAAIGTCMGGPIGFVAGLKLGSLAAVGCGITGYFGGKLLKESNVVDEELPKSTAGTSQKNKIL